MTLHLRGGNAPRQNNLTLWKGTKIRRKSYLKKLAAFILVITGALLIKLHNFSDRHLTYQIINPYHLLMDEVKKENSRINKNGNKTTIPSDEKKNSNINKDNNRATLPSDQKKGVDKCAFRSYHPNRSYKLNVPLQEQPSYLSDAMYIRGLPPHVINANSNLNASPKKLCIDTVDWEFELKDRLPFSDGQNPSLISLSSKASHDTTESVKEITSLFSDGIENKYIGMATFGDSTCKWNMTEKEIETKKYSRATKPPSKRTMIVILDQDLIVLKQVVLMLRHDSSWGTTRKKIGKKEKSNGMDFEQSVVEFDDARFFAHDGKLFVLYRNGPIFGYENQVQNQIHIETSNERDGFHVHVKASETFVVCCGRNIAFFSERSKVVDNHGKKQSEKKELKALIWIDPVSVKSVDFPPGSGIDITVKQSSTKQKKKSSIHGTNGYLLPLENTSELMGIAHFHRPEGRQQSDYARHGHHYTHAFFTIKLLNKGSSEAEEKYYLSRISNEFVFSVASGMNIEKSSATDIIQFASGLDLLGSDIDGKLLISYGINDCEAASISLNMKLVQELLIQVPDGSEVGDLMQKL